MNQVSYLVDQYGARLFQTDWEWQEDVIDLLESRLVAKFPSSEGYSVFRVIREFYDTSVEITQSGGDSGYGEI